MIYSISSNDKMHVVSVVSLDKDFNLTISSLLRKVLKRCVGVLLSYEICATGWLALTKGWLWRHHPSSQHKLALIEGGRHNYRQTHFIRIMHTQTIRLCFGKIAHYHRKNIQKLFWLLESLFKAQHKKCIFLA